MLLVTEKSAAATFMSQDQMFIRSGPMKETFKYSMETQAKADSKIGSAAEHLHSNNSVLPKEDGANIFSFMSPPKPKNGPLFKKVRSSVRYLKQKIFFTNCYGLRLYYAAFW